MAVAHPLHLILASALALVATGPTREANRAEPDVSSLTSSAVTIYSAKWCSACRSLESALSERKIAFSLVDVDDNPSAFAKARSQSGSGSAIPLTSVLRANGTVWIVGADADAIERAERGE